MRDPTIELVSQELDYIVSNLCDDPNVVGASLGVIRDQHLVWSCGYGFANKDTESRPDENTIFRIASVTKTFTATALFQLRDAGMINLDDPLTNYIDEFSAATARHGTIEDVTIRRLLCHHSGLICEPTTHDPYWETLRTPTIEEILESLNRTEVIVEPDKHFKYSNLGFALLGEVIARVSGQKYEEYVKNKILIPMDMTSTFFDVDETNNMPHAIGYETNTASNQLSVAPTPHMKGISAAGQLYSTVSDLTKWISLQLRTENLQSDATQILAETSIREMHRPVFLEPDWSTGYGLPWISSRMGNHILIGHTGYLFGYRADVSFNPTNKLGLIALFNTSTLPPIRKSIYQILLSSVTSKSVTTSPTNSSKIPKKLEDYLGQYNSSLGLTVSVDYTRSNLECSIIVGTALGFAPGIIRETGERDIFVSTEGRWIGETVKFVRSASNIISGFELGPFRFYKVPSVS